MSKTNPIDQLANELNEAKQHVRSDRANIKELQKVLAKANSKLKHQPDSSEYQAERDAAVEQIADAEYLLQEHIQEVQDIETRMTEQQIRHRRDELLEQAKHYSISVPMDNPIVACQMLSAIASNLQYQYCSSRDYYESLLARAHGGRQFGTETGGEISDAPVPEVGADLQDQIDDLRQRREYIQMLRFVAEREFKHAEAEIPADSNFQPKLLFRTDAEVYEMIDRRNEERMEQRRREREQAKEAIQSFDRRVEDSTYVPGAVNE